MDTSPPDSSPEAYLADFPFQCLRKPFPLWISQLKYCRPSFVGGGEPAAGNDTVDVNMVTQFLVPRVKYLDDPGCCAEVFMAEGKFQESLGAAFVQKAIQECLVTVEEGI